MVATPTSTDDLVVLVSQLVEAGNVDTVYRDVYVQRARVLLAWGLPRVAIEEALLAHGTGILDGQLGLDPRALRLVCIPPDVHVRLGDAEAGGATPSGPTSTDTSSWPKAGCAGSPAATSGSVDRTTSSGSVATTIPTA